MWDFRQHDVHDWTKFGTESLMWDAKKDEFTATYSQGCMQRNFTWRRLKGHSKVNSSRYKSSTFSQIETRQNTLWYYQLLANRHKQACNEQPSSTNTWNIITNILSFIFTLAEVQDSVIHCTSKQEIPPACSNFISTSAQRRSFCTDDRNPLFESTHVASTRHDKSCHPRRLQISSRVAVKLLVDDYNKAMAMYILFSDKSLIQQWDRR